MTAGSIANEPLPFLSAGAFHSKKWSATVDLRDYC
jgi:hypothetical protein